MLTTQDVNKILTAVEKVFDRNMDEKLRPLSGQLADFRKEFREFKQEMYEFKGDMAEFRDQTQKILENIFDDLQGKHETEKQLKSRLTDLEQIHPGGQHLPAFKTLS